MELKQVEYFLKIAEAGNFSLAAEELFISQSSLSKQILALEKELGFALFDRGKRKIALTPAGEAFSPHGHAIYDAYLSMLANVAEYKTTPAVSIIAIPVIAQYGIPAYLAEFKTEHPEIALSLEEREASVILPALNNRQCDLAFVRDNYLDSETYDLVEVAHDRFLVALSQQHRLAARPTLSLAELADENFILFDKGTVVHELAVDACRSAGFEPRIFYASLRVESVLGMVASNSGVALMMEKVLNYHRPPHVVAIPLEQNIESRIVLASPKGQKRSRAVKTFVDFIKASLERSRTLTAQK